MELFHSDHLMWNFTSMTANGYPLLYTKGDVSSMNIACPIRHVDLRAIEGNDAKMELGLHMATGSNTQEAVTELHIQAGTGNAEAVQSLLTTDKHLVNARTVSTQFTPLHFAVFSGNVAIAEALMLHQADVNAISYSQCSPLECAIELGNVDMVLALKNGGASLGTLTSTTGTYLHLALEVGALSIFELLIEWQFPLDVINSNHMTAIHIATNMGNQQAVECLINRGASVTATCNAVNKRQGMRNYSLNALHLAAHGAYDVIAMTLMNAGAEIDGKTKDGVTPLHFACSKGSLAIVEELIRRGADVNASDYDGFTPLHDAAAGGHLDVVKVLVDNQANVNAQSSAGNTPLHIAALRRWASVVSYLVNDRRAQLDILNSEGTSALHHAVKGGSLEIITMLLQAGADPNIKDASSWAPIHHAGIYNDLDVSIVPLLLEYGKNVDLVTKHGWTPLHCAAYFNSLSMVNILLANKANVNAVGKNGWTPLLLAFAFGADKIFQSLIQANANVNAADAFGWTVLHFAAQYGLVEVATLLLQRGGTMVDSATEQGITPLHIAVRYNSLSFAQVLVKHGADVNRAMEGGVRPIHLAARYAFVGMADFLLRNNAFFDVRVTRGDRVDSLGAAVFNANPGVTLLFLAIRAVFLSVDNTPAALPAVQMYLGDGGTPNICRLRCGSLLSRAVACGNEPLVALILRHKPNFRLTNYSGLMPLHYAVVRDRVDIAVTLMKNACPFDTTTSVVDSTPMRLAWLMGLKEMTKVLERVDEYFNFGRKGLMHGLVMLAFLKLGNLELFNAVTRTVTTIEGNTLTGTANSSLHPEFGKIVIHTIMKEYTEVNMDDFQFRKK